MMTTSVLNACLVCVVSCCGVPCSYFSQQGKNLPAPPKANQDSLVALPDLGEARCAFAVFDGHGPFGEHASVR